MQASIQEEERPKEDFAKIVGPSEGFLLARPHVK